MGSSFVLGTESNTLGIKYHIIFWPHVLKYSGFKITNLTQNSLLCVMIIFKVNSQI